jgi:hypothetical protein
MANNQSEHDLSFILEDGSLAETVYDPDNKSTAFAAGSGDGLDVEGVKIYETLHIQETDIKPIKPTDPMLTLGFIKLPAWPELYKDDSVKFLFASIQLYLKKYIYLPEDFYPVVAVYVLMTWVYDRFSIVPYLRVIGAFGSGKTRFLQVVGSICYKATFFSGSTSTAGVYRTLNQIKGTMVFDETDFKNSEMWTDMIKILNAGHDRNFPAVRMEPKKDGGFVTKVFHIFGPKILASRERFADEALESRCISQRLHYQKDMKLPIILPSDFDVQSGYLRKVLLMFRFKNYKEIKIDEVSMPEISTSRVKQTFTAMAVIAKMISDEALDTVLKFGKKADQDLKSQLRNSLEVDVLVVILEMISFKNGKKLYAEKLYMLDIAKHFQSKFYDEHNDKENRHVWNNEDKSLMMIPNYIVSAKKIGSIISKLGIHKDRDGRGFYIPARDYVKIFNLKEYFGISSEMITDDYEESCTEETEDNDSSSEEGDKAQATEPIT